MKKIIILLISIITTYSAANINPIHITASGNTFTMPSGSNNENDNSTENYHIYNTENYHTYNINETPGTNSNKKNSQVNKSKHNKTNNNNYYNNTSNNDNNIPNNNAGSNYSSNSNNNSNSNNYSNDNYKNSNKKNNNNKTNNKKKSTGNSHKKINKTSRHTSPAKSKPTAVPADLEVPGKTNITKIEFTQHFIKIPAGKSINIAFKTTPVQSANQDFIYKSSNNNIASFKGNKVTGINKGFTTIIIMLMDGSVKAACPVKVI